MGRLKAIFGYVSLFLIFVFTIFSNETAMSALSSIRLCYRVLVPTLFPMMVLTGIAIRLGALNSLGKLGNRLFSPLFGINGKYFISFIIGALGSAPTGALAVKNLTFEGDNDDEAQSGMLLSSVVSFGFIYSVIGLNYFHSGLHGILLFLFQIISVMITAAFLRPRKRLTDVIRVARSPEKLSKAVAFSIRDAASGMLSICGSVIFFSALSGVIVSLPLPQGIKIFVCPFFELVSGIQYLSGKFAENTLFVIISSAVGWSGLSMIFQTISVSGDEISPSKYIIGRAVSALICPMLALLAIWLRII